VRCLDPLDGPLHFLSLHIKQVLAEAHLCITAEVVCARELADARAVVAELCAFTRIKLNDEQSKKAYLCWHTVPVDKSKCLLPECDRLLQHICVLAGLNVCFNHFNLIILTTTVEIKFIINVSDRQTGASCVSRLEQGVAENHEVIRIID